MLPVSDTYVGGGIIRTVTAGPACRARNDVSQKGAHRAEVDAVTPDRCPIRCFRPFQSCCYLCSSGVPLRGKAEVTPVPRRFPMRSTDVSAQQRSTPTYRRFLPPAVQRTRGAHPASYDTAVPLNGNGPRAIADPVRSEMPTGGTWHLPMRYGTFGAKRAQGGSAYPVRCSACTCSTHESSSHFDEHGCVGGDDAAFEFAFPQPNVHQNGGRAIIYECITHSSCYVLQNQSTVSVRNTKRCAMRLYGAVTICSYARYMPQSIYYNSMSSQSQ